jgi:hypothetical protein
MRAGVAKNPGGWSVRPAQNGKGVYYQELVNGKPTGRSFRSNTGSGFHPELGQYWVVKGTLPGGVSYTAWIGETGSWSIRFKR